MIRGINVRGAIAVNVITMIGIGPLITIPLVLAKLHGSLALAGWIIGALIAICDGLVWAEMGSRYIGSGGTYVYLREALGPHSWGRLFAFLFVWEQIFSWPLTLASGYIGFSQYAAWFVPALASDTHAQGFVAATLAIATVLLLYRRIESVARLSIIMASISCATLLAVILAGVPHVTPHVFLPPAGEAIWPALLAGVGPALILTTYDYYGYGQACMVGDEVTQPERTLPVSIFWSIVIVCALYLMLQVSVLSVVPWQGLLPSSPDAALPADANYVGSVTVMRTWGPAAAAVVTVAVLMTAFASTFGNLLGAARLPYAAALDKLFFSPFARLHPTGRFPHVSLLVMGLMAVPFCFLSLGDVIAFLVTAALLTQNVAQIGALFAMRAKGERAPFRMWLYPLPAAFALAGWLYIFLSAGGKAIAFGLLTLVAGLIVFLVAARRSTTWPFGVKAAGIAVLVLCAAFAGAKPAGAAQSAPSWGHSLVTVTAEGDKQFRVDGKPFFLWGASFFYERLPRDQWDTSLDRIKELGFNTIDLYVPWNWHELSDGEFDFDGHTNPRRDLRGLLTLVHKRGFKIVVRPGPVIRNEWRNGGYPAWLLSRPEYNMPQHEILEGRYPSTATLQNAHSDDAAAEWMANGTHMKYAARWLQTALHEFSAVADDVIAIQLDDDQAAYIDNQTYPAPHLYGYLRWLRDVVHGATAASVPVYINTYQPKAPASLPVWEWGNWYQGGSYQLGQHDLNDLTFSTLLLGMQQHGPTIQSEFQAGWLAAPEDQLPRPSAPSSTTLALYQLLALGVKGIIDFPPQDTLAPAGWEAPFTNWFYAWDAAIPYEPVYEDPSSPSHRFENARMLPTQSFAQHALVFRDELAEAHRVADGAIAYNAGAFAGKPLPAERISMIVNSSQAALDQCAARGLTCDMVDLQTVSLRKLSAYRFLVLPDASLPSPPGSKTDPARRALASYSLLRPGRTFRSVPADAKPASGIPGATGLQARDGSAFVIAVNSGDDPKPMRATPSWIPPFWLGPHDARIIPLGIPLSRLSPAFAPGDMLLVTTCLVRLNSFAYGPKGVGLRFDNPAGAPNDCEVSAKINGKLLNFRVASDDYLPRGTWDPTSRIIWSGSAPSRPLINIGSNMKLLHEDFRLGQVTAPLGRAVCYRSDQLRDGFPSIILQNDLVRVAVDPNAGGRAFLFEDRELQTSAFNMTGALRDDVARQMEISKRDYIAAYTHSFPAGTFNRPYTSEIVQSGDRAVVKLTYDMPDALPSGARFEKTISLEPGAREFTMSERVTFPGEDAAKPEHGVSIASLSPGAGAPADWVTMTAHTGFGVWNPKSHLLSTVTWSPAQLEGEELKPFRSSIVLFMRYAPHVDAITTYGLYIAQTEEAARAQFTEVTGRQSLGLRL